VGKHCHLVFNIAVGAALLGAVVATDDRTDSELASLVAAHTNWASFDPVVLGQHPDEYLTHPAREAALESVIREGDLASIRGTDFLGFDYYFPRYVTDVGRADDPSLTARFDVGSAAGVWSIS
jgi:beta-glucosidase/6-phospho-beta-glucosidase/beta-galactosidase